MKNPSDYFSPDHIGDMTSTTKDAAIAELCDIVKGHVAIVDFNRLKNDIIAREMIMSTGIGSGVAIPHARTSAVHNFVVAVGRSRDGIDFESLDDRPVGILILMAAPERERTEFLKLIATIGDMFNDHVFRERFMEAGSPAEIHEMIIERIG